MFGSFIILVLMSRLFSKEDDFELIKMKYDAGEFESFANTQEVARELLFDFGYSRGAVIDSGKASRRQVDTVIRNQKNGRLLHQPGRRSILDYAELMELYDWIDYRIYRHEQSRGF